MSKPFAFHDLPADAFPVQMRFYVVATGELVWEATVEPYYAVDIPGLAREHGPVRTEIELATGEIIRAEP